MVNPINNLDMASVMISLLYRLAKNPMGEQENLLILMESKISHGPLKLNLWLIDTPCDHLLLLSYL